MPTYSIPLTENRAIALQERGLDALQAHLEGRGFAGVRLALVLDPLLVAPPVLTVEANADPTAALASAPWPQPRNLVAARQAMRAFMEASPPTNAQAIAALRGVIVELAKD
jgi:hypothetical protein